MYIYSIIVIYSQLTIVELLKGADYANGSGKAYKYGIPDQLGGIISLAFSLDPIDDKTEISMGYYMYKQKEQRKDNEKAK